MVSTKQTLWLRVRSRQTLTACGFLGPTSALRGEAIRCARRALSCIRGKAFEQAYYPSRGLRTICIFERVASRTNPVMSVARAGRNKGSCIYNAKTACLPRCWASRSSETVRESSQIGSMEGIWIHTWLCGEIQDFIHCVDLPIWWRMEHDDEGA